MSPNQTTTKGGRVAFTFSEFAAKCGRDRGWVYRMVRSGKLRAVTGYGVAMIPATEIERVFGNQEAAA